VKEGCAILKISALILLHSVNIFTALQLAVQSAIVAIVKYIRLSVRHSPMSCQNH